MIYLVEMVAAIDAAGTTTTLRATTAAHYATRSTDTPANTQYLPRVKTAGLFRRDLDAWLDYAFDGRECRILAGEEGAAYADFVLVLKGTMDQIQADGLHTLTVRIRDRLHELDKPIQSTAYLGNNSLPAGLEGVEDLKGKLKPRAYGNCVNISPPCVNTSRLIYQASDQALYRIGAVYDQGVALTAGSTYSSQSDMETTAPSAGQYRVWAAGGMFRLGSTPSGQITCDAQQYDTAFGATSGRAASLMQEIAEDAGIATADISAADVTALNAATAYPDMGVWLGLDDASTALQLMDYLATSVGAWYGFDRLGSLRMAQLAAPTLGAVVHTFGAHEILDLHRRSSQDAGAGVPAWDVKVRYYRNWTPQRPADLAGSVTLVNRQFKTQEWRNSRGLDATVKTKHPLAWSIEYDTASITEAYMAIEADRRLALLKVDRALYEARVHVAPALLESLELGAVVRFDLTRFGLTEKPLLITGILHDPRAQAADLTLWG